MVCTAPTSRYSLRCRICFHRLHGYLKPCRSSICAPPLLALSVRRASSTVPRMQAPFSGGFRMLAALRSPLSISRIVPRSAFACPIVKEQRKPKFAMMEINANKSAPRQPHPRFYWRFRTFTDFSRDAFSPKNADCAVLRSERRTDGRTHERTRNARTHATHASAHKRTPTRQRTRQRTHMHTRAPAHMRTHASRMHAHARTRTREGPPPTASEPNGNGRHFCARSKCKANGASASA